MSRKLLVWIRIFLILNKIGIIYFIIKFKIGAFNDIYNFTSFKNFKKCTNINFSLYIYH
jgi:hypothetical protein